MCSGRVDLEFIFRAFAKGQDGVFIGGCKLDECNYVTHGNYDTWANTFIAKKILAAIGIEPDRLRTEFMSGADSHLLAAYTNDFAGLIKQMGPVGQKEGLTKEEVDFNLTAARRLVPYMRLAERQRLRIPEKSKISCKTFFDSRDTDALLNEILTDRLAISRIMLLLEEQPFSIQEIAQKLGLTPSDVSRHMMTSSRHGMVKYDTQTHCYTRRL